METNLLLISIQVIKNKRRRQSTHQALSGQCPGSSMTDAEERWSSVWWVTSLLDESGSRLRLLSYKGNANRQTGWLLKDKRIFNTRLFSTSPIIHEVVFSSITLYTLYAGHIYYSSCNMGVFTSVDPLHWNLSTFMSRRTSIRKFSPCTIAVLAAKVGGCTEAKQNERQVLWPERMVTCRNNGLQRPMQTF